MVLKDEILNGNGGKMKKKDMAEKDEETANNLFDESTKKYFEKKLPRALELIDDAIHHDPSNNLLYCFKVSIMLEQRLELQEKSPNNWKMSSDKILEHALETIDDAIEIKKDYAEAWHLKGIILNERGENWLANKCFRIANEQDLSLRKELSE